VYVPDKYHRTIEIPVRIRGGAVELLYGSPLPPLEDDTVGTIIVPAFAFRDSEWLEQFKAELTAPILPRGSVLLVEIHATTNAGRLIEKPLRVENPMYEGARFPDGDGYWAILKLDEPLELTLRGSKHAVLAPCSCTIPCLDNKQADSVNHAYTLLSTFFEPHRRAHTGNVFRKTFFQSRRHGQKWWVPLDDLRSQKEAAIEKRVITMAASRRAELQIDST
jgi:hypothetical protein